MNLPGNDGRKKEEDAESKVVGWNPSGKDRVEESQKDNGKSQEHVKHLSDEVLLKIYSKA